MIPSRGLRWSSQTIGIGRRRLEISSARQFSSVNLRNAPIRTTPLLSSNGAPNSRIYTRSPFSRTNLSLRNGTALRFASTKPLPIPEVAPITPSEGIDVAADPNTFVTSLDNASDFAIESLLDMPERLGFLKALGLDYGWGPTSVMEFIIEHVHVLAGTPWWASIILTAFITRAGMFRLFMNASDASARMTAVKPMLEPLTNELKAAQAARDQERMLKVKQEQALLYKRAGIKLWRVFFPFIQIFTGYGSWKILHAMADLPLPGLENGGFLWLYNLAVPDPYFIIPLVMSGTMHYVMRKGGETGANSAATMTPVMRNMMLFGLPVVSFLFVIWQPAAVQISFLANSLFSLFQLLIFRSARFRARFGMFPIQRPIETATTAAYKGTMMKRAPISQAELNRSYTRPGETPKKENPITAVVGGAIKDIKSTVESTRESAFKVLGRGKEEMEAKAKKQDRAAALKYEAKRQEEIKREVEAKEDERRARTKGSRKRTRKV